MHHVMKNNVKLMFVEYLCSKIKCLCVFVYVPVGEKEAEDKDLNSEAPSSLSEVTSEKEANSVSQSNTVSSRKEEEHSNSIKKVTCHFEDCSAS